MYNFSWFVCTKNEILYVQKSPECDVQFWTLVHAFLTIFACTKCVELHVQKVLGGHLECVLLRIYVDFEWDIRFFIAKKSPPHLAGGSWSICIFLEIFHFFTFFHNFVKTKHRLPIDDGNSAKQQNFLKCDFLVVLALFLLALFSVVFFRYGAQGYTKTFGWCFSN